MSDDCGKQFGPVWELLLVTNPLVFQVCNGTLRCCGYLTSELERDRGIFLWLGYAEVPPGWLIWMALSVWNWETEFATWIPTSFFLNFRSGIMSDLSWLICPLIADLYVRFRNKWWCAPALINYTNHSFYLASWEKSGLYCIAAFFFFPWSLFILLSHSVTVIDYLEPLCHLGWRLIMEIKLWCLLDREVGMELPGFTRPNFKCVYPPFRDKLFLTPKDYY